MLLTLSDRDTIPTGSAVCDPFKVFESLSMTLRVVRILFGVLFSMDARSTKSLRAIFQNVKST